jgi:hypothetical protein
LAVFRKTLLCFIWIIAASGLLTGVMLKGSEAAASDFDAFERGDIVFQTSGSSQSLAIMLASKSAYSHVGMIDFDGKGRVVVLEAIATTRATPLSEWVKRGMGWRIAVYRLPGLSEDSARKATREARRHFGKAYDLFFFNGEDTIYCSELVYLAYKAAGIELGAFQTIGSLSLDNIAARKVIEGRWERYPLCANGKVSDFESCLSTIKKQTLITPDAIARDTRLQRIYSNYGTVE